MQALKTNCEKILFGLAAALLAASCLWSGWQRGEVRRIRAQRIAVHLTGSRHETMDLPLPENRPATWPEAPGQSAGKGWLYEVFTPPIIHYDALTRSFAVTPPILREAPAASFGLELLMVKQEQFRLQLEGYFGLPNDYLVAFTSPKQSETLLVRTGHRFENLGLTLKSFAVRKIRLEPDDGRPVCDVAAFAVIEDDQAGGEVVLDSRMRKFMDAPLAVLRPLAGGQTREVRAGDTFVVGDSTYRIDRIQLDPPEVVVARIMSGLPQPEVRRLRPPVTAGGLAGRTDKSRPPPGRPATGFATSDR